VTWLQRKIITAQCVNYFRSWHIGTTNKLLQTALYKWTQSKRVHYYNLDGTEDDVLWAEQYDKSDTNSEEEGDDMYDEMVTHKQIQQMFSEESDD